MANAEDTRAGQAIPLRHVAAVVAGNALEFYDFLAYSFFALQIGRAFFPSQDPHSSLLLSLATFGAGFLARPIGGLVIGRYADRAGRKPAMMLSFSLMGISIVGLALTPPYRSIGVAAPIMVLAWRLIQGFALGGEVGPTTAFLIEAAPPARRGFYSSLQFATQDFAIFVAGGVGFALSAVMSDSALDDWGWRIAFLIGALVVPVGLAIRRTLPETLHSGEGGRPAQSRAEQPYLGVAVLGVIMLAESAVIGYVQTYLTTYAAGTLRMSSRVAFAATIINGLVQACFSPVGGILSDRFGRKPVMIIFSLLLAVSVLPAFLAMIAFRTPSAVYGATALMAVFAGIAAPPILTAITEALPQRVRAGALATIYALALSVFGGSTQFVVAWLIGVTGNPYMPGWTMVVALIFGLGAMLMMPETCPAARHREPSAAAGS
ncbi:MAG TPA: MFS transporter [Steroidobacteraceae bacterium]|nr:MFS transporter [Steroidobacteraceae bacterium]